MLRCLAAVLPSAGRVGSSRSLSAVTTPIPNRLSLQPLCSAEKDTSPLLSLRQVLAFEHSSTANRVKSFYTSLSARSQLSYLTPHDLSTLISLFGSLSSPGASHPPQFLARQTLDVKPFPGRNYWRFVLQVAKDKCQLRQPLTQSDCYWLMQAQLAHCNIKAAAIYYKRIALSTANQDFHVSYLSVLLKQDAADAFVDTVSFLIRKHKTLPSGLFFAFSSFVTTHCATSAHKARVAGALSTRFGQHVLETRPVWSSPSHDARGLMELLVDTFKRPQRGGAWELNLFASLFSPSRPVGDRWDNFVLLIFAVTTSHSPAGFPVHNPDDNDTHAIIWRSILLLATAQGLASISPSSALPQLRQIVRAVWRPFAMLPTTAYDTKARIPLVITFLRLASGTKDGVLVEACGRHCLQEMNQIAGKDNHTLVVQLFAELCVASISCARHEWKRVLLTDGGVYLPPEVASLALHRLTRLDLEAALKLCGFCFKWKIDLLSDIVHTLACRLASANRTEEALEFLNIPSFTPQQREYLLNALLHPDVSHHLLFTTPRAIHALLPAVRSIVLAGPTSSFAPQLQCLLLNLIARGKATFSLNMFLLVLRRTPNYFHPTFSTNYLNALLFHRQFKSAARFIAELDQSSRPLQSLHTALFTSLIRAGAHNLARRRWNRLGNKSRPPVLQLYRKIGFKAVPLPFSSLAVGPFILQHRTDVKAVQSGFLMLVKAQRLTAARRILSLLAPSLDNKTKTLYGNIILHGTAQLFRSTRNGRALRRVLHVLESLKKTVGFLEDGVTKNIVLGVTLRWRDGLTNDQLRALYDQQAHNTQGRTSFSRHIRPMYRMFIKAFHLRGDRHGASTAIRGLKDQTEWFEKESQKRALARSRGRKVMK